MRQIIKYTRANSLAAILLLVTFALLSFDRFNAADVRENNANLERCIRTFWELIRHKGAVFSIVDGKLLAGSYVVNGNFEVPDKVQEIFGGTATVFMGDMRVSTNVLQEDGRRAVGTRLEGPAYDAVFRQGKAFRGETRILGVPYITAYDPIRDSNGKIIGALYVGLKKSEFLAHHTLLKIQMGLILLGLLAAFTIFVFLINRLAKKVERTKEDDLIFLQTLIDTIPNPIFYKDVHGRYLGGNKAFADVVGLPVELLIGKTVLDIAPPHLAELYHQADQELIRTQGMQVYESSVAYADGIRHDVIFYKATFPAANGAPGGLIGTMLDITERKRAEVELCESRQYLSDIIQFYPDGVLVIDHERKVVMWNKAMEELTGVQAAEMLGRGDYEYALPFYGERRPVLIDLVLKQEEEVEGKYTSTERRGSLIVGEAYIHNARGEEIYAHGTAAALRNSRGEVVGAIESVRDVTARKRTEEEVELKNIILSTQQECSLDGILVVDESNTILSYNRRFVELWGIPPALVEAGDDAPVLQFVATRPADPEGFLARVRYLYAHREEKSREEIALKDGRVFDRYSAPMTGANGKYYGRVWYFRDITELQRARQDLLKTQKLESLGVLAGGIAHDFNNILTAILGNISLARIQVHEPEKMAQRLEDAENAAVRAKDLTQQLLTFARGGEPVKKVIMLSGLIKEAAGFAVHGSAVTCEFVLADDLWPVEADDGQISQVIHNLVINAVQAMPDGGTITIVAHNADSPPEGKRFVDISVADTGTGIQPDLLQRIFDPYFTTKQQGSGLGLASCYSIIHKHDGNITVESTPGKGTTFYVSLPAVELIEETEPALRMAVACGKGRVLVMDDEEMVREIAQAMLEELGYETTCAANGDEAIGLYRKSQEEGATFVAVIMDLTIPGGMGGKEAIKPLLALDPDVKAVVSSGYSADPVMANYKDFGFSAVLGKPYRLDEMSAVLEALLADRHTGGTVSSHA